MDQKKIYPVATRLTALELEALRTIAQAEERKPADVLRRLIRSEARRRGLEVNGAQAIGAQLNCTVGA